MVFGESDSTPFLHSITCSINSGISAENKEISEKRLGGRIFWGLEADIGWSGSFFLKDVEHY